MPSKSRMVKGSRKRLFIKRPVFIDCNCCSHREESLHVISCLSSHSDVQTFLPRLSLSRRPSRCRAGSISSHRHVTQRGTQTGEEDRRRVKRHWTKSDNMREEDEDGDKTVTSEGGRMKFGIQRVKHSVCWEDGFQLKGFARDILSIC